MLYDQTSSARERDIFRDNYLNLRGWKTYRIWSQKWWLNQDDCISQILELIKKA